MSDQEQTMDLCSIAVPLVNEQKKTVASINVSLDIMRRSNPDIVENAKTRLIEKGQVISRILGHEGPYPVIFSQNP
jgi:DNA-binding IclR family transcriptional regulator